jgi:hypothetical protein
LRRSEELSADPNAECHPLALPAAGLCPPPAGRTSRPSATGSAYSEPGKAPRREGGNTPSTHGTSRIDRSEGAGCVVAMCWCAFWIEPASLCNETAIC